MDVELDTEAVLAAGRRIAAVNRYGFLATSDARGGPSVRMVQHLEVSDNLDVAFSTSPTTRKAAELRASPDVAYSIADESGGAAVTIYGPVTLGHDSERRRALWLDELELFFPGGPDSDDFLIVEIAAARVEVWSFADGIHPPPFGLNSASILRTAVGWTTPTGTHPYSLPQDCRMEARQRGSAPAD